MKPPILEIRELRKAFGGLKAVDGVSFAVQEGACAGLVGPNGAGKTTTLSMLAGLLTPDSGEVLIEGRALAGDTDPLKRKLGLVPQDLALYDELTARDNLVFFGKLYSVEKRTLERTMTEALEIVGLTERAGEKVKRFSGGMKRRLNLAAALLHEPQLLLLDEPTVGVDPQSRNAIFDNIEALRARGKTILYTTHYMEEIERLCDRVIIMDHGKVVVDDTLGALKSRSASVKTLQIDLGQANGSGWVPGLRKIEGVIEASLEGARLSLQVADLTRTSRSVLEYLNGQGLDASGLSSGNPSLESIFLSLTGHKLRD